jgi:hypothetical protein
LTFSVQLKTQLTAEDYGSFVAQVYGMTAKGRPGQGWVLVAIAMGAAVGLILPRLGWSASFPSLVVGVVIGFASFFFVMRQQSRGMRPNEDGVVLGEQIIELREEGIQVTSRKHEGIYKWAAVLSVEETPEHYFIMLDTVIGFIIPKRCFGSLEEEREFMKQVRSQSSS